MKRSTHTHTSIRLLVAIHGGRITANINTGDFLSERGHPLLPPSPERTAGEEFLLSPDFSSLLASFPFIGPHTVPKRLHASLDFRSRNMSRRLATVSTTSQRFWRVRDVWKIAYRKNSGVKKGGGGGEGVVLETPRDRSKLLETPPPPAAREVSSFREFENSATFFVHVSQNYSLFAFSQRRASSCGVAVFVGLFHLALHNRSRV